MGFADMLYQLGIGYATYEGRKVAEEVMTCINQAGHNMSCKLAEEKRCISKLGEIYILSTRN